MDRLDDSIRRELGRFGPADDDLAELVRVWPAAVGPTVARNAWPARLAGDGTLHVNAASSTWAFELGRLAETIAEQLERELGKPAPSLRFAPGPVPGPEAAAAGTTPPAAPRPAPEHRAEADALTAEIEDEELRALVARAAAASLAKAAEEPPDDRRF